MQLLQPYTLDELRQVVSRAADKLSYLYDDLALDGIAVRSRGTPRVALRLLRRCVDAAVASQVDVIDGALVEANMPLFVILTLQAASDGEGCFAANGNLWASVRAFLSQGKDDQGNYKPSLWFTVKAFTTKEGDAAAPKALQAVNKGEKFTVKGRLGLEEWADSEGNTRQTLVIFASHAEPFANGNNADTLDDEP